MEREVFTACRGEKFLVRFVWETRIPLSYPGYFMEEK